MCKKQKVMGETCPRNTAIVDNLRVNTHGSKKKNVIVKCHCLCHFTVFVILIILIVLCSCSCNSVRMSLNSIKSNLLTYLLTYLLIKWFNKYTKLDQRESCKAYARQLETNTTKTKR